MNIAPQQIVQAADAGFQLLNAPSTMVPGHMRAQLAVLEVILDNVRRGQMVVAPAPKAPVELPPKGGPADPKAPVPPPAEPPAPRREQRAEKIDDAAGQTGP